jgi:hypothetical protein
MEVACRDLADILLLWRKRFYDKNQNQLSKVRVSRVLQVKRKTGNGEAAKLGIVPARGRM